MNRITQLNNQLKALSHWVALFCCEQNKDVRTRIVDAMNRTTDAVKDRNEKAMRRAARINAVLLEECERTEIPDEVRRWVA